MISYDGLPISSGGAHTLRLKDRAAAWERMRGFLAASTTRDEPDEVRLLLAAGEHVDTAFFDQAQRLATSRFGTASRRLAVRGGSMTEHEHAWSLGPAEIDEALGLMNEVPSIPEHLGRGLLVLSLETRFFLRDPRTGEPLPDQGVHLYGNQDAGSGFPLGESRAHVRLSCRSTCSLFLSLPFQEVTPEALNVVASMQEALPFRLSPKHWARWQLNAQATRYYKRRLSLPAVA